MTTILGENLNDKESINIQVEKMHIPRFSYRKKFHPLEGNLTTDRRWGCCIRCCQDLLAQFIKKSTILATNQYVSNFFSNISKINSQISNIHNIHNTANSLFNIPKITTEPQTQSSHSSASFLSVKKAQKKRQIHEDYPEYFNLFFDAPSSPFSIHSFCSELKKMKGILPGKWIKLSTLSLIIKQLLCYSDIETVIAENGQISRPFILDALKKYQSSQPKERNSPPIPKPSNEKNTSHHQSKSDNDNDNNQEETDKLPVLILIPLMLGLKKLEDETSMVITKALSLPKQSIGVIGGKNNKAYYIIGYTDKGEFLYFDPHEVHDAVVKHDDLYRVYEPELHKIKKLQLNSSIMIGFIVKTSDDINEIEEAMKGTPVTVSDEFISFSNNNDSDESSKTAKNDAKTQDNDSDDDYDVDNDYDMIIVS